MSLWTDSETALKSLKQFKFERVLNEDPSTRSITLLGRFPSPISPTKGCGVYSPAILKIEKTAWDARMATTVVHSVERVEQELNTDIYTVLFGWMRADPHEGKHVKIDIVFPATDVHIRKYSKQSVLMVSETPELYQRIVKPYITSFPPARTQWVQDILSGVSEASKVLYSSPTFLILPDMKWDSQTVSTLYLVAITHQTHIRSLRDLRKSDVKMLREIKKEASKVAAEKWKISPGGLRFYVHYQPSYYHFHVHIVNANSTGSMGMAVGQAHLLDDIISMLELDPDEGPSILERLTFTYGLGDQHGLYTPMMEAQAGLNPGEIGA